MEHEDNQGVRSAEALEDPDVDQLAERVAAMQLESAASRTPRSPGLRLQISNPFEQVSAEEADEAMATASPYAGGFKAGLCRTFMRQYETYMGAINALQTQWGRVFAMPVGACIDSRTKRMVAQYEFNQPPHLISEDQMMNLQADLEAILDKFNLTDVAFEHEQRRIVKYLANALTPASFKAVIVMKLTLHENKRYKNEVVPFCSWVTKLMREFMNWEHAAQAPASARSMEQNHQQQRSSNRGNTGGRGASGDRGQGGGRGQGVGSGGGDRSGANDNRGGHDGRAGGDVARTLQARGSTGARPAGASDEDTSGRPSRGACLKCRSMDHQVRDCPSCQPGEATRLLQALRERREAARDIFARRFAVVEPEESPMQQEDADDDRGTVAAEVDGQAVTALLLGSGADTSLVTSGVLEELRSSGKDVPVRMVNGVRLNPVCGHEVQMKRQVTFKEVVLTTSAGPLMLRNLACYVEEDNASLVLTVGRPVMKILGYSTDKLLAKAKDSRSEWEVDEIVLCLEKKVEVATKMGLTLDGRAAQPDAQPVRAQPRRYSPNDPSLLEHGFVFKNHRSRWASAPRIVRKREQNADPTADPRMTIDTRGVNERTDPMPWTMPVLEVVLGDLEGAKVFFVLDWFRGYWQLPLHPDSQELYSFVTHRGIYTPIRRCAAYDLKLHAKKCQFFATERVGSHKKTQLAKVRLEDIGSGDQEITGFEDVRTALLGMVPLAHPSPTADVCLYTDASQDFWGAVVTQLESHEVSLPLDQQNHRPLAFLSGRFVGAAVRWPTIEKEAPKGFRLYTDHRNLVYIFDPYATDGTMAKYQADKLQRWALSLLSFRYVIEHVPGEANVWGYLLSRWGAGQDQPADRAGVRVARLAVVERVSPIEEPDFVWPTEAQIKELQQHAQDAGADLQGGQWSDRLQLMVTPPGQVCIPADSAEMQQRLCIIAHAGAGGHRGAKTTAKALSELFFWPTLTKDVAVFVDGCLHCMMTAGDRIPRPFGETLKATKPNELLHFDYLTMIEGDNGMKYVLVLKDGMSGFVELISFADATADNAYQGLIDWFKRFGVEPQWVSDQGAHFRNQIIELLQRALGVQHHFTTAYTPWANGTVKVVNREILKCVRALLSERKLHVRDWPAVLPVVQAALNGMTADRLNGVTPLTAFTALPGGAQLRHLLHPHAPTEEWVTAAVQAHLAKVRAALDGMHAELVDASEKRRLAARARHARHQGVRLPKFSEGDFVLVATATDRSGHKLALIWRGPKRIIRALNDYTFEVQDIVVPFAVVIRHASRLQLYRDAARG
uniref:Integrase catalytic domain-containing protein n=1 Tax=Phytophthora ramorum TaxID=164328 RepID=H3H3G8_PHYRM